MARSRPLVVLGARGNCLDIVDAVRACGEDGYRVVGFLDDDDELLGRVVEGVPVLGRLEKARSLKDASFVNGIGSPRSYTSKATMLARLEIPSHRFATIIHPRAVVSPSAEIGAGSVVLACCVICANVTVGQQVMMLPGSVIGHDSALGDHSILAAGVMVSGAVAVGQSCYLGVGACVRDGVRIGAGTLVGAGAVLVNDCQSGAVLAGNPARVLRRVSV